MGMGQWDQRVRLAAEARAQREADEIFKLRQAQEARYVKERLNRPVDRTAPDVAQFLSNVPDANDVERMAAYQSVADQFRGVQVNPQTGVALDDPQLLAAMRGMGDADKTNVYATMASQMPRGFQQRVLNQRARVDRLLARDTWEGGAARAGMYSGIAAGGAMGLTAAGQGLMALTDYVQQTMVNQESREQPLV